MKKNTFANIVILITYIATLIGGVTMSYRLKKHYIKNKTSAGKQMLIDAGARAGLVAFFYGTLFGIYKIAEMKEKSKKKVETEIHLDSAEDEDWVE